MEELLKHIVPNLALWLSILIGLFLPHGRKAVRFAAVMLALISTPAVPEIIGFPLRDIGRAEVNPPAGKSFIAIFGAGAFAVEGVGAWPGTETVRRLAAGLSHQERSGLPVAFSGGDARGEAVTEVEAISARIALPDGIFLDDRATNTAENAHAFARFASANGLTHAVIATSPNHVRRAAATLRSHGLTVAMVAPRPKVKSKGAVMFIPSLLGLVSWSRPVYEWVAITWYLIDDRIAFGDL